MDQIIQNSEITFFKNKSCDNKQKMFPDLNIQIFLDNYFNHMF